MSRRHVLPKWWRTRFLRVEFVLAVLISAGAAAWIYRCGGDTTIDSLLNGTRATVYGVLASIFGSLLGFIITTLSIIVALASLDRLAAVRESAQYQTLWRTFVAGIRSHGLATAVCLIALVGDREAHPSRVLPVLVMFAVSLAVLRLGRCLWILERVLALAVSPSKARAPGEQ